MHHGRGGGESPVDEPALEAVDLLSERGEKKRNAAARPHRFGKPEAALAAGDGEDPFTPALVVHEESDHLDPVMQVAEIMPVEDRQQVVHRIGPPSHKPTPDP